MVWHFLKLGTNLVNEFSCLLAVSYWTLILNKLNKFDSHFVLDLFRLIINIRTSHRKRMKTFFHFRSKFTLAEILNSYPKYKPGCCLRVREQSGVIGGTRPRIGKAPKGSVTHLKKRYFSGMNTPITNCVSNL